MLTSLFLKPLTSYSCVNQLPPCVKTTFFWNRCLHTSVWTSYLPVLRPLFLKPLPSYSCVNQLPPCVKTTFSEIVALIFLCEPAPSPPHLRDHFLIRSLVFSHKFENGTVAHVNFASWLTLTIVCNLCASCQMEVLDERSALLLSWCKLLTCCLHLSCWNLSYNLVVLELT